MAARPLGQSSELPAIDTTPAVFTAITPILDEPTTFYYEGGRTYEPNNYHEQYRGEVLLREALWHSLNVPTIKIAEKIGYDRVANFAKRAGLNAKIKGYPSVALGAFEVTPIEMVGAYTIFANGGKRMQPHALLRVTTGNSGLSKVYKYEPEDVIRPELAFLMTHLMEGVIARGTGAGVRARGFQLPAAGKTGTSRDGWFAGYTKDLLAIAWVGYDDNSDLNIEGAHSALPIWTAFMSKAYQLNPPSDPDSMYFESTDDIDYVQIDRESLALATPACVDTFEEAFISGTAPATFCPIHSPRTSDVFETGIEAVGEGVKRSGSAIGSAVRGIGRVFGGIFGRGTDPLEKPKPERPHPR
jgi:penicillin-binding protein 1B